MEAHISHIGFVGSAVSLLTTLYFWLVRVRQERPCLRPYLVDSEFFVGASRGDMRQLGLKAGIVVANYCILPNAILGARLWVRLLDGWQDVGNLAFDKQTPLPFNIPPMQTVLLRLNGTLSFPYQEPLEGGSKTAANYLSSFVAQPLEIKLELRHLHQRPDTHVLTSPAEHSCQQTRPLSNAA